ncbi:dihydrodipicolinate synthase family protein [Neomoorella glycerini]|nr:dihydrodipicolinate synthase family protein [Moorella glycerini]
MCPPTPMTPELTLDEEGIRENIEAYIDMGVNGLVVGGFISECWNVKLSDWFRYHEIVADANKGRMDLWTIILDPSVHQALEKMAFVEKLGYSGAEVMNPAVQLRTDDEIYDFFKYMSDHSNLAICLYRTPVSGKVLSFDLMKRLADLETVVAVKQGSLNHAETLKLRRELRDDFIVSEPWERFFLDDLRHGGQVIYGELSYIIYGKKRHLMKEYMDLARAGKWEEAYQKWAELRPVGDLYDDVFLWEIVKTATYASALAMMKTWYEAIGLKAGPMLPPVRDVAPERKEWLRARLKELGVC